MSDLLSRIRYVIRFNDSVEILNETISTRSWKRLTKRERHSDRNLPEIFTFVFNGRSRFPTLCRPAAENLLPRYIRARRARRLRKSITRNLPARSEMYLCASTCHVRLKEMGEKYDKRDPPLSCANFGRLMISRESFVVELNVPPGDKTRIKL